jgi:hypothetical protein
LGRPFRYLYISKGKKRAWAEEEMGETCFKKWRTQKEAEKEALMVAVLEPESMGEIEVVEWTFTGQRKRGRRKP